MQHHGDARRDMHGTQRWICSIRRRPNYRAWPRWLGDLRDIEAKFHRALELDLVSLQRSRIGILSNLEGDAVAIHLAFRNRTGFIASAPPAATAALHASRQAASILTQSEHHVAVAQERG